MPKFKVTETQEVIHTYIWEVEAENFDEALDSSDDGVPDYAIGESETLNSTVCVDCLHVDTYMDDRMQTICKTCNEELGR